MSLYVLPLTAFLGFVKTTRELTEIHGLQQQQQLARGAATRHLHYLLLVPNQTFTDDETKRIIGFHFDQKMLLTKLFSVVLQTKRIRIRMLLRSALLL